MSDDEIEMSDEKSDELSHEGGDSFAQHEIEINNVDKSDGEGGDGAADSLPIDEINLDSERDNENNDTFDQDGDENQKF